ncbi:MAG: hypothetical protein M3Z66_21745 [Chloroflexota bacterium]|nr:hypothetical protein [Chloroflexota bacterium]
MPEWLAGVTAGEVEGDGLEALTDLASDRDEPEPEGAKLQVRDMEAG